MTIVCGTDFSENAAQAVLAAGAIARRLGEPLALVHVIDELGGELAVGGPHDAIFDPLRAELRKKAEELRASMSIDVEPIALQGVADEQLIAIARTAKASLLVVSALGARNQHRWLLGSVAERVAQSSPIPVLVVRDGSSLLAWARGDRPLRVVVGVELSSTSKAALRGAAALRRIGRCDLFVTEIVWPLGEHLRLGIPGSTPLDQLRPELHEILIRDLRAWAGELPGEGETTFTVRPGWGRTESHLTSLAAEVRADLLVVGTHRRAGIARMWQGSVSRGVLHHASTNVACVPRGEPAEDESVIPTFRQVLVPTDFSPLSNRAIPVAYGLVVPGGVVHLLYVVTRESGAGEPEPKERLRALIPKGAAGKGITTELEIVAEETASMGIWHAAGRLGVDAICMATHGRSGVSSLVLGSQAREVVQRAREPVLLVPPGAMRS
jgi:nucleotide-binding universal stress UspA family protein